MINVGVIVSCVIASIITSIPVSLFLMMILTDHNKD